MGDTSENKTMKHRKHICLGILAHVDAGKTTLAEGILYKTGRIRSLGRVDHQDAFLDNFELERARGITIFSKQAEVMVGDLAVTLMDTPGHVDFSAEMERTLQILDYAVLVISGADGVQSHVETLWRLLQRYGIPVFLFVNKMDQPGTDRKALMEELTKRLDGRCVDFTGISHILEQEEAPGKRKDICRTSVREVSADNEKINAEASEVPPWAVVTEEQLEETKENLAVCDEALLEYFLENGEIPKAEVIRLIRRRRLFPCYFGSALKLQGVDELLEGIRGYTVLPEFPEEFGARVFKITRDGRGSRLTHMRITGGTLKVKDVLTNHRAEQSAGNGSEGSGDSNEKKTGRPDPGKSNPEKGAGYDREKERDGQEQNDTGADCRGGRTGGWKNDQVDAWEQKADQIRIYSGSGYETACEAGAGTVCAVTGLDYTYAGQGLGIESEAEMPLLEPVLSYRIEVPPECDVHRTFLQLRQLEEEEPELHIVWDEHSQEIHAQLMGEVQIEVLKSMIRERFGIWAEFGTGSIVYKETISGPVEGIGHFEPLRHYAEVHLLMEPGERGSGLQFAADCSEDVLDRNWQRLILTHLAEKQHRGVLTGSEITDMKITLVAGRAHQKHTEGGDFRQATYRAVRHGLKRARSILLEPVYEFRLEVPQENVGRAMSDIQKMNGSFAGPEMEGDMAVLTGQAPVVTMQGYQREVIAYSRGRGRISCSLKGYEECHNAEEVIAERGYDSELDFDNPTGSVFCAHGAGYVVSWDLVHEYAHVDSGLGLEMPEYDDYEPEPEPVRYNGSFATGPVDENELKAIFERTYGSGKGERRGYTKSRKVSFSGSSSRGKPREKLEEYLLVDGYNIIFAWEDLKELAGTSIDAARDKLMDIMCNLQGYKKNHLILVFDAYKVPGGRGEVMKYHNIHVVYTKEAETADQYIEKTVREIVRKYHVTVATSDALEQVIILGGGAVRMSAAGLREEVERMQQEIRTTYLNQPQTGSRNYLFDQIGAEKAQQIRKQLE